MGLSPKDFGLYVRSHPDSLLITAANKMRSGEKITLKQNYTGKLIESFLLPLDSKVNDANGDLIARYWGDRFGGAELLKTDKGWFFRMWSLTRSASFLRRSNRTRTPCGRRRCHRLSQRDFRQVPHGRRAADFGWSRRC